MTNSEDEYGGTPVFDSTRQTTSAPATYRGPAAPGTAAMGTATAPGDAGAGKTDVAKEEAARVADSAKDAAADVAGVAKDEAREVAHETKAQAQDLYRQTQQELREQAAIQQQRVADGLRSIGDELAQMSSASQQQGVASDIVGQAAERTHSVARWLGERDPGSLLREVKSYARRNPGTFIAAAALTGVLAGRLTRALASGDDQQGAGAHSVGSSGAPAAGAPTTGLPAAGSAIPGGTMGGALGGTAPGDSTGGPRPGGSL
ncbi:hypothetical protein [Leifsonia shinshuensis]|uniref:Gas vesicle protein n=1 Tax=Leifsonia shinshuensis TaxID=150026 RepID=A0A853CT60_9MICO|nr:hypothetical protein [Leifsonia shinshuensis]NYJ22641.1 gas vesicle protein [Leifsonia shinshuensis]